MGVLLVRKLPLQTAVLMALVTVVSSAAAQGASHAGNMDPYRADPYTVGSYCYRPNVCYEQGVSSSGAGERTGSADLQPFHAALSAAVNTRTPLSQFDDHNAMRHVAWLMRFTYFIDGKPGDQLLGEAADIVADLRRRDITATIGSLQNALQPAIDVALEQRAAFFASALSPETKADIARHMQGLDSSSVERSYGVVMRVLNRAWHADPDAPAGSADAAVRKALKLL